MILQLFLLTSCANLPSERHLKSCPKCEKLTLLQASEFPIIALFLPPPNQPKRADQINIYLEGDGNPWPRGNTPAVNPTGRRLLALKLLQQDPEGGFYLSRPCYGFDVLPVRCEPNLWTHERYSHTVVQQMNQAIDALKALSSAKSIRLYGHSGGGTLAMLIAYKRSDVSSVVTIAANLDHKAWTNKHGYTPLEGSQNVAMQPPLAPTIRRIHLMGGKDNNVTPDITKAGAENDPFAQLKTFPSFNHKCCWEKGWPEILKSIEITQGKTSGT